ncbi:tetratricopeptide repeat protein [Pedobacter psychrodurus]|uniref:tetratricopeptide repeat-containing sensor histidine kinase n=1 Tax=Pedobacter psychrodurus TaxID=2530456 RepID=UPI002931C549|nr:tetratricopeptide repeat protein [Pedobacter psychrodurus]
MKSIATFFFFTALTITCSIPVFAQKQGMKAIDSMKSLLKALPKVDSNQVRMIYRISEAYLKIDPDSALHYGQLCLERAEKSKWQKGIAGAYANLGTISSNHGDYAKAMQYYNQSLAIQKRIKNRKGEIASLINIGVVYRRQDKNAKALEYAFGALKIASEIKDEGYAALIYQNIADLYHVNKDYKKSLNYGLKAHQQYEKLGDLQGIASSANQVGTVYYSLNDFKNAGQYFKKSLKTYEELGDKMGQAGLFGHIALLHEDNKDEKLEFLFKAQQLYDELYPLFSPSITNLGNIGGTYAEIFISRLKDKYPTRNFIPNNYKAISQKAEFYLTKAVNASKEVGDLYNLSYYSDNLAQLQEENGQYKEALKNYKIAKQITDSIYSQENKNQIATLEAQYAFQKKEDGYKQQQTLAKVKNQQTYLYTGLAILLITSVLIYFLNRSRIHQLRLKNRLQQQKSEQRSKELLHQYQLSESELKAIRSQMNPHFIFNVLNSIEAYVMDNEKRKASRLIQKFASLTRLILENSTKSLVTADKEWKALMLYTELEAIRYDGMFTYTFTVGENIQLKTLCLPPMLIQPLIENAILHGLITESKAGAHLSVIIHMKGNSICITVADNGVGITNKSAPAIKNPVKEQSLGLASIKERIDMINKQQSGIQASFRISAGENQKGTVAIICLPIFEREPELINKME